MTTKSGSKNGTDWLVDQARNGDAEARRKLMERHRGRLRNMVSLRLDPRLAARVDPSDVVQEALAAAYPRLDDYLRDRPLPFYPWLRQFAWDCLVQLHRRHVTARRRSVKREQVWQPGLSSESVMRLSTRLLAPGSSPSDHMIRRELRDRLQAALAKLAPNDREVLVMRNLEQMPAAEIAAVLGIKEGTVRVRHLRALERLRALLDLEGEDDEEEL
jgi:RNA polymerase sigma-70 factor (ECF subfamily)